MAKKKNKTTQYLIWGLIIGLVAYIVYMMSKGKKELRTGCYIMEETHPAGDGTDYVCLHPDSRPQAGYWAVGDTVVISNTDPALDGSYEVLGDWTDVEGRQGCLKINHNYSYVYEATQGGDPRDISFFGIGELCKPQNGQ